MNEPINQKGVHSIDTLTPLQAAALVFVATHMWNVSATSNPPYDYGQAYWDLIDPMPSDAFQRLLDLKWMLQALSFGHREW